MNTPGIQRTYLYAFLGFSLPFPILLSNIAIILIILHWIYYYSKKVRIKAFLKTPIVYFLVFYTWQVTYLLFSEHIQVDLFDLEKKLAMLLLPIVVFTSPKLKEGEFVLIIKSFIFSTSLAVFICCIAAFSNYLNSYNIDLLFYNEFSKILGLHPLYFSLYISFSLFSLISLSRAKLMEYKFVSYVVGSFLIAGLILSSSRIIMLSSLFVIVLFVLRKLLFKRVRMKHVFVGLIICLIPIFAYLSSENLRERFEGLKTNDLVYILNTDKFPEYYVITGERRRALNIKIFLEAIKDPQVFLFGMGNTSASEYLNEKVNFYRSNYFEFKENLTKYNFHNQYMEMMMGFGVVALLLLIKLYFLNIKNAISKLNDIHLVFIILIVLSSLTEAILERNKGIIFFTFFCVVLNHLKAIRFHKEKS